LHCAAKQLLEYSLLLAREEHAVLTVESLAAFRKESLITIVQDAVVMEAQALAKRHGIHHVPVTNGVTLVGMVCTCDMLVAPGDVRLREIMKVPVTLPINSSFEAAAELMHDRRVGSVLLLEEKRAVGIITRGEVMAKNHGVAERAQLPRCECCGVAEHLRTAEDGHTFCIFCLGVRKAQSAS
jgi:CBS domain-containing protein